MKPLPPIVAPLPSSQITPTPTNNLGRTLATLGKADEAVAALRRVTAINSNHADGYAAQDTALKDLGKFDEAAACLQRAIAVNPSVADWHNNLGIALSTIDQRARARGGPAAVACGTSDYESLTGAGSRAQQPAD
jgi:Flp pilus assembly protein TadD